MGRIVMLFVAVFFIAFLSSCGSETLPYTFEDALEVDSPEPLSIYDAMPIEPTPYIPADLPMQDIPSWEVALEELLIEFLSIFTQCIENQADWLPWEVGGWRNFVHEYGQGKFYIADPVTGEKVYAAPYILTLQFDQEYSFIATSFYLHDIDSNGIPVLLIRWRPLGGHFEGVSMLRYTDGEYAPVDVSVRHVWNLGEVVDSPFLFQTAIFSGGSDILAKNSEDRTLILGAGGAGGFGTWAYMLHMENGGVRLEPIFNIRVELLLGGEIALDLFVYEPITGECEALPRIEPEDALFIPVEWFHDNGNGLNDVIPVPIPIMPDVTVTPFPRMSTIEQQLTEQITTRLIDYGRILP